MNILILGSGGREHAITWKCKFSSLVKNLYVMPGNPGIAKIATCIPGDITDFESVNSVVKTKKIDLIIPGPELPLVLGIKDYFEKKDVMVFGPSEYAAKLEGSKAFSKNLLKKYNIPTALFENFDDPDKALEYVDYLAEKTGYPIVIKADGLAAGKGVIIAEDRTQAEKTITDIMRSKIFGEAGAKIIIEEFLKGEEASIHLIVSKNSYKILTPSQDHKQVFDGDKGPNTGGMGAYAPCPLVTKEFLDNIEKDIIKPLISAFEREALDYEGVLYIGIMVADGKPYVLEFNVRLGDPETQVILPLLDNDLVDIAIKTCENKLDSLELELNPKSALALTCASKGYPGAYDKGKIITGLDYFEDKDDAIIFHAGTSYNRANELVTSGGRVLTLVTFANDLKNAIDKAYTYIKNINFEGMHYRKDIGQKGLK